MEQRTRLGPAEKLAATRSAYEAFSQGDISRVAESWTDDIVWHSRGSTQLGGDFKGKEGVYGFISRLQQEFEEFKLEIHDMLANDEHVVVLLTETARRHGETYESPVVHVHHVNDEGKTSESWFLGDTEQLKWALEH
jgi:ketosteroid isomerase-like protein